MDSKKERTLKKVLRYIGKYKLLLPLSLLFALITVALTLYLPKLIGDAINLMVGKDDVDFDGILSILIKCIILIMITALSQWLMSMINNKIAYSVAKDVREDAFQKIERLPLSYLDKNPEGDLVNRVVNDTEHFSEGLLLGFTQTFTGILTILGTLALMITINFYIAAIVVVLTPLSLFIAKFISKHTYEMFTLQSKTKGEQTALINEYLTNQKLVLAFSQSDEAQEKFDEVNGRLETASLKAIFYSSLTNPTTRFVYSLVYAVVALVGAITVVRTAGGFSPGALTYECSPHPPLSRSPFSAGEG